MLCKVIGDSAYDVTFVIMGTLYLAGDNLPILICSSLKDTKEKGVCRGRSSIILGVSLLLHTALYLVSTFKLKSLDVASFPVTGRIRKAYQSILQLGSLTIFIDQTFSTVEQFTTHLDIEDIDTPNCGCVDNTTAANCLSIIDVEVGGFFAGLFSITFVIVFGLMVKNWKAYCSCCGIKMRSNFSQCCCHLVENLCIFSFHFLAFIFMVLYTLADNTWVWKCVRLPDPTPGRIPLLSIILVFNLTWIGMYFTLLCLPGIGIVCEKGSFWSRYEYAVTIDRKDGSVWVRESSLAQIESSLPQIESSLPQIAADKSTDSSKEYVRFQDLTESTGSNEIAVTVTQHSGGALSIFQPLEEDTTCWQGLAYFIKWFSRNRYCDEPAVLCGEGTKTQDPNAEDPTCWEWLKKKCNCNPTCWEWLKEKCKCRRDAHFPRSLTECFGPGQAANEELLLTYVGKKENVCSALLTKEGKLELSREGQTYSPDTEFWVIKKPTKPAPPKTPRTHEPAQDKKQIQDDSEADRDSMHGEETLQKDDSHEPVLTSSGHPKSQ